MAGTSDHTDMWHHERLPLDSFTRSCLPGWCPGLKRYSLRRWLQLLTVCAVNPDIAAGTACMAELQALFNEPQYWTNLTTKVFAAEHHQAQYHVNRILQELGNAQNLQLQFFAFLLAAVVQ